MWALRRNLILALALTGLVAPLASANPSVAQAAWVGWDSLDTIAILSPSDTPITEAANDLQKYLGQVSGKTWQTVTGDVQGPAIRLAVDPVSGPLAGTTNQEAFWLVSDDQGIRITGKTSVAVGHGASELLQQLGFRFYFSHPAWHIIPNSLPPDFILSVFDEPASLQRGISNPPGYTHPVENGGANWRAWIQRNRLNYEPLPPPYEARHSWGQFIKAADVAAVQPDAVCYRSDGVTPFQVLPDHPYVIEAAKNYARAYFDTNPGNKKLAVPISPNDGNQIWCNEWKRDVDNDGDLDDDPQIITDKVFALTNEVAKMLQVEYPGTFASVLSYSWYSVLPSFQLEPNVYVQITTFARGTTLNWEERLAGFESQGVLTGFYDYFDVWPWWKDRIPRPQIVSTFLPRLVTASQLGAKTFHVEGSDNWAPKGRIYWATAQLMWDPGKNIDDLLEGFYGDAFGPAKVPMQTYYSRFDEQTHTDRVFALAFKDLDSALALAVGNLLVQERIRQVLYHTYFWWRWGDNITANYTGFQTKEDAEALYAFIWRIKNLQIITFSPQESATKKVLANIYGLSESQIGVLQDFTPPSVSEARTWLDQALSSWDYAAIVDAPLFDALDFSPFATLGSAEAPILRPYRMSRGPLAEVLIPSDGSELVTVGIKTREGYDWIDPSGEIVLTQNLDNLGITYNITETFDLPAVAPGIYTLRVRGWGAVDVPNRPAAVRGPLFETDRHFEVYFFVPLDTPSFVISQFVAGNANNEIKLTAPNGMIFGNTSTGSLLEVGVRNPQPGIWQLVTDTSDGIGGGFRLIGVPPLVWHDPANLLIPAVAEINVAPTDASVGAGGALQFMTDGFNGAGGPVAISPAWSVSGGGTIDVNGLFTADPAAGGVFTVTATDGDVSGSTTVTVGAAPELTSITVTPNPASIVVGQTLQFSASGLDQYGNVMAVSPAWSISSGGSIDANGLFTATTAGGPYTVTATDGTVSGSASVSVTVKATPTPTPTPTSTSSPSSSGSSSGGSTGSGGPTGGSAESTSVAATIVVSPSEAILDAGQSVQFSATGFDGNGIPITVSPTWSATSGGDIDASGLFTAEATADGAFIVTASAGGVSGSATVTVTGVPTLTTINVTPESTAVATGDMVQFTAFGADQHGAAFPTTPTWSVSGGGTIDSNGLFTATVTSGGAFTVAATDGNVSGTASVMVSGKIVAEAPPLITVEIGDVEIPQGGSRPAHLVLRSDAVGVSGYTITIAASDPLIASIGTVTPTDTGIATVTQLSSGEIEIKAANLSGLLDSLADGVVIATIEVEGLALGETEVLITSASLDDLSGATIINVGLSSSSVTVADLGTPCPTLPTGYFPADIDDDGRCEDINGNGGLGFNDVVLFFDAVLADPSFLSAEEQLMFDFNLNGSIDFADVNALFEMVS